MVTRGAANPIAPTRVPPLWPGDRLNREEFERRFDATPALKKAELIEGVVYMPPPVLYPWHSRPHGVVITWLGHYAAFTPHLDLGADGSIRMGPENMPQPDAFLMIAAAAGGQAKLSDDGYVVGGPELIAEVAASSASYDLSEKREVYQRNGVREYIVIRTYDAEIDYFVLRNGRYDRLPEDPSGTFRSEVFPSLWLDRAAMLAGDLAGVLGRLQEGMASPEHRQFSEGLRARAASDC